MTDRLRWFVMSQKAADVIACEDEAHARLLYLMLGEPYVFLQGVCPASGMLHVFESSDPAIKPSQWPYPVMLTVEHLTKLGLLHARNRVDTEQTRPTQERLPKGFAR